ncbi:MAG: Maf family protein [Pseudomonadota bacterium]
MTDHPMDTKSAGRPVLILASASPRRRELLSAMGCEFVVDAADIDETRRQQESPEKYVQRLAREKAAAVAARLHSASPPNTAAPVVLAADTIVAQGQNIFGKPSDREHAYAMWQSLSDTQHTVMTAVCLHYDGEVDLELVQSQVQFCAIGEQQMARYWESGEPADKAGAYAIQGLASAWVQLVHGSYSNVVGLPLHETNRLLKSVGHNWL